ncbi:hypothetical protein QVD17_15320 [Tagetes erecta]|uniref:Uncharacterized protein n=1 Tax=Tagetes erecta TaxID=13708 RepID=A0AAD8KPL2_TARER|nr:hypothetical protein QVD17_15320 [Tagetes erecta]
MVVNTTIYTTLISILNGQKVERCSNNNNIKQLLSGDTYCCDRGGSEFEEGRHNLEQSRFFISLFPAGNGGG